MLEAYALQYSLSYITEEFCGLLILAFYWRSNEDVTDKLIEAPRASIEPIGKANRSLHRHLGLKGELTLALLPTVTVLAVLGLVETFSNQRLLFASLASSAFLIYLDPQHGTNNVGTLILSQATASLTGWCTFFLLGPGYAAAATAMMITIVLMIILDAVHPPAVSTALGFAFRANNENNLLLFGLALGLITVLVALERMSLWLLAHYTRQKNE